MEEANGLWYTVVEETVMIELTEQQRQELAQGESTAIDPQTKATYVLVRKEIYDRMKGLLDIDGNGGEHELRLLLARSSAANGWDEPGMDAYDRYDEERRKRCP
jgi:hypothetical protein